MTKQEFLTQLQRDLNGSIGSKEAAGHVAYYQEYIEIELRKGHPLKELMEELGSPELIARSITDIYRRTEEKKSKNKEGIFEKVRKWFNGL